MKITYHIPTEQYGFVEIEEEVESCERPVAFYNALKTPQNAPGQELDKKTMDGAVCEYLSTGELVGGTELYQQMSPSQQEWFQITKRAFARIKSKE